MTIATPNIEDVLLHALADTGVPYVYGRKGDPMQPVDTGGVDCSGLVKRSCDRAGVRYPVCPDGSWNQWNLIVTHGRELPVEQALHTRGALMFIGPGGSTHVAWSLGDKTTIEARGKAWGVGTWAAAGRFQLAGLLPGIDYSPRAPYTAEDFMQRLAITIPDGGAVATFKGLDGVTDVAVEMGSLVSVTPLDRQPLITATTPDGHLYVGSGGRYQVVVT